ncbi:hypothetical protein [Pseudomonas sp. IT-P395]|jgi:hypothetical protein|uniref:hypothetical protein n=1 Tax=Pseudomonas sp. IT-P395 TaxID=3026459 RepID=UPI0039E11B69
MNTGSKTFVCAGAIILLADELSTADRSDSLDALLYSQTVASHKVSDVSDVTAWTHANKMAMRATGALLLDNPGVSLPLPMPDSFTLLEFATRLLHHWIPATVTRVSASAIESQLKQVSVAVANESIQPHILSGGNCIRFMLGFASAGTTLSTVILSFESAESIVDNVLHHRFNSKSVQGNVFVEGYRALIDPEDYIFSRAKVISLLGERRQEQIIALS